MFGFKRLAVASLLASISHGLPVTNNGQISKRLAAGQVIYSCSVPGTIALTFDDGPFIYTDDLLSKLAAAGVKATFFLNGNNYGNIEDFSSTVQRMYSAGHQIGSHTYSHADLATLSSDEVAQEMSRLDSELRGIIGVSPTYMRPPYFSYNDETLSILGGLGYHIIQADIDTLDYANLDSISTSIEIFQDGVRSGGSIALQHDVHAETVNQLVPAILEIVRKSGLKAVTVGECLGDPASNWYRSGGAVTVPTTPSPTRSQPSTVAKPAPVRNNGDYKKYDEEEYKYDDEEYKSDDEDSYKYRESDEDEDKYRYDDDDESSYADYGRYRDEDDERVADYGSYRDADYGSYRDAGRYEDDGDSEYGSYGRYDDVDYKQ